jgi:hypothetical protein
MEIKTFSCEPSKISCVTSGVLVGLLGEAQTSHQEGLDQVPDWLLSLSSLLPSFLFLLPSSHSSFNYTKRLSHSTAF